MEAVSGFLPKTDKGYKVHGLRNLADFEEYGSDSLFVGTIILKPGHSYDCRWGSDGSYGLYIEYGNLIPAPKEKVPFTKKTCPRNVYFRWIGSNVEYTESSRRPEGISICTSGEDIHYDWRELRQHAEWSTDGETWHKCETEST